MSRRGAMLVEAIIAAALVGVAMFGIAQLLAIAVRQELALDQRRLAAQEAANGLEKMGSLSWSEIRAEKPPEVTLSDAARTRLPAGHARCELEISPGPPMGMRILSEVSWRNRAGETESVRLIAWRFSAEPIP